MFRSPLRLCLLLAFPVLFVAACSEDDPATPPDVDPPAPYTLCVADRNGDIYTLNEETGQETLLVDSWMEGPDKAPVGLGRISSMVYVAETGLWWLGSGGRGTCEGCILTLDPQTGEATQLAPVEGDHSGDGISGLAIHPTNGRIFTFCSDCGNDMYEIDPVTGAWTQLDDAVGTGGEGNGTTFSSDGLLFVASDESLYKVNYEDSSVETVGELTYTGFPTFEGSGQPIVSMTTRPGDGAVFGILLDGGGGGGPGASYLVRVNLETAEITNVGANTTMLAGLAFVPDTLLD